MQLTRYLSFCLFVTLLLCTPSFAQSGKVKLKQLTVEHGLSQTEVRAYLQDHEGFLWIGTAQGLNLFDGYRIRTISGPNRALELSAIASLYKDDDNNIWVGAVPNKNFLINKKANEITEIKTTYPDKVKTADSSFQKYHKDKNNDLWLSTFQDVFVKRSQNKEVTFVINMTDHIGRTQIVRALASFDNHLIIGTSLGLYAIDKSNLQLQKLPLDKIFPTKKGQQINDKLNVKGLHIDDNGNLLLLTVEGLYEVNRESLQKYLLKKQELFKVKTMVADLNIWGLVDAQNSYWLATNLGLYRLSKDGVSLEQQFKYSDTAFDIGDDNIIHIYQDNEGSFWLGSRGGGAFMWRSNSEHITRFQSGDKIPNSLSNNQVWSVAESADGNVWVGTNNGLNRIDQNTGRVEKYLINPDKKATISNATINEIEINGDQLYLSTSGGIRVFNSKTQQEEFPVLPEKVHELFARPLSSIKFTSPDNMMILSSDGIHTYNLKTQVYHHNENTNSKGDITKALGRIIRKENKDPDKIYISMVDQIVSYSASTGAIEVEHALPPADKPRTWATDFYNDGKHSWAAYPGFGIYVFDNESGNVVKQLTEDDGLPDNSPLNFVEDGNGNLLVTSNSGLSRIDKKTFHIRVFDTYDGLSVNEFNGGAYEVTSKGNIILGSVKGVMVFNPKKFIDQKDKQNINANISKVSLMSRDLGNTYNLQNNREIKIYHTDYGLKVEFSALNLSNAKKIKYKYWLEGSSQIDATTTNETEILLPRLSSGFNSLKVTAIDPNTGIESQPHSLNITVYPAPYLSWWALTSYLIIISSLLFSVWYQRKKRHMIWLEAHEQLKQNEERLQLALTGSNSGMWDWQSTNNMIFDPRLTNKHLNKDGQIEFSERASFIHENDQASYQEKWQSLLNGDDQYFEHIYRLKNTDNSWTWYKDSAKVTQTDEANNPSRITGTFTDISEQKDTQDKMQLFFEAFDNTRDIIVILNEEHKVIAVNHAFYRVTNFDESSILFQPVNFLKHEEKSAPIIDLISKKVSTNEHIELEAKILRQYQSPLSVLVNATNFVNGQGQNCFVLAITDISEQKLAQEELKKLANYDPLTSLPNRALFLDRVTHAIENSHRNQLKIALFFIDLDRFKQINDTLGHDVGDLLLIEVSKIFKQSVRDNDTVARLGGDEFVILIENIHSADAIRRIAQKIIDSMSIPLHIGEHEILASPSIGIANYPTDGCKPDELLKHADMAMYHAKSQGRNNFQFFQQSMNDEAHSRMNLEKEMRAAIQNNEFTLYYQPQIDLASGKVVAAEALARWFKNDGTLVSPGEFIPLAEELGLIIPLTEQLIYKALEQAEIWHNQNIQCHLCLNLSARHLHHYDLINFMKEAFEKYPFIKNNFEFEITETVLMDDISKALTLLNQLKSLGITLALDDFGTGYSSLKYLHQLPIQKLKIDRSFVWEIGKKSQSETIIEAILSMSKTLNLTTVIEGVETKEQLDFVKNRNADSVQGFYFTKPVDEKEILKLLTKNFN